MATIRNFPFFSRLRADSTMYVQHLTSGRPRHVGRASAFWFRPDVAAIAEVPMDDREQSLLVTARTADFQTVRISANVTYRVVDPDLCLSRINFGIDVRTGLWDEAPLDVVGGLLVQLTSEPLLSTMSRLRLQEALTQDIATLRGQVLEAVRADVRLPERGLEIVDVRIAAIRAENELERALQTQTREQVQQEADKATFERRALAVERERAIAENELQNKIALARQEHVLVTEQGKNKRERATEDAAAEKIRATAHAEQLLVRAKANAERVSLVGKAEAEAERERVAAYAGLDRGVLLAVTAQRFSGQLPAIENLTITPDMLTRMMQTLGASR